MFLIEYDGTVVQFRKSFSVGFSVIN